MPTEKLTEAAFREAVKAGKAPADVMMLRKGFTCEVTKAEGDSRTLDFTISTPSTDRMGDKIMAGGWKLDAYRKNPVMLWAHDSSMLPVAKATNVRIDNGKLRATAEFTPAGMSKFNDTVFEMYKGGFLSATSVGFMPLKWAYVDDNERSGIDFMEQELLEFSAVPVPANAEALIEARAAGIDLKELHIWARSVLKAAEPMMDPEDCPYGECPMKNGKSAGMPSEKLSRIIGLPEKFRDLASTLPSKAKVASGQLRRCANMIEKALATDESEIETVETVEEPAVVAASVPLLNIARRRLELARRKIA